MAKLLEKSLLQQEELFAHGEFETTQQAHAAYFLSLAEQAEAELEGPRHVKWLERLER